MQRNAEFKTIESSLEAEIKKILAEEGIKDKKDQILNATKKAIETLLSQEVTGRTMLNCKNGILQALVNINGRSGREQVAKKLMLSDVLNPIFEKREKEFTKALIELRKLSMFGSWTTFAEIHTITDNCFVASSDGVTPLNDLLPKTDQSSVKPSEESEEQIVTWHVLNRSPVK